LARTPDREIEHLLRSASFGARPDASKRTYSEWDLASRWEGLRKHGPFWPWQPAVAAQAAGEPLGVPLCVWLVVTVYQRESAI